jgi:hypothetical protein
VKEDEDEGMDGRTYSTYLERSFNTDRIECRVANLGSN